MYYFKKRKRSGIVDRFIFTVILIVLITITLSSLYLQIKKEWINQDYLKINFEVSYDSSYKDFIILASMDPKKYIKNLSLICNGTVTKANLENLFYINNLGYKLELKLEKPCNNFKLEGINKFNNKKETYYVE